MTSCRLRAFHWYVNHIKCFRDLADYFMTACWNLKHMHAVCMRLPSRVVFRAATANKTSFQGEQK